MGLLFALSLPGLVCLLVVLAAIERLGRRRGSAGASPLAAGGFEEVDALLGGAKRIEVAERQTRSLLAQDEKSGAAPRVRVDLDAGTVATFASSRSAMPLER